MWRESYETNGYYDFDYALQRLAMDPLNKLDQIQKWVDVPVRLGEDNHVVRVKSVGDVAAPKFEIIGDSTEEKSHLIHHVIQLFQWERDLETIHNHFLHTNLKELFEHYPGTPVVKDFDLYGSLMKTIIHQQLNLKFAHTLTKRFVEKYGEQVDGVWFMPKPETIASLPYEALREFQLSQRKAEYVIDTSRLIVAGELDLHTLANQDDAAVIKALVKVRGIGAWTAENWLLFALGRKDLLPKADIGIQNALKGFLGMDRKPTINEITSLSQDWSPYRSYASLTLWRSIE